MFIENKDNKPYVNHIDYNPLNNNVTNLEWCTQKENVRHSIKNMTNKIHHNITNTGHHHISYTTNRKKYRVTFRKKEYVFDDLKEAIKKRDELIDEFNNAKK